MKNLILLLALAAISQSIVFSQGCLPEGITFTTQEQIDNFQVNYPGCTEILGDVQITSGDISSLIGLNMLTSIGGELRIFFNSNLQNLEGLNNLNYVGGLIEIWANDNLTSISGLNGLTEVGGSLIIDNYTLLSLEGLESLTEIGGILQIKSNSLLANLNGLNELVTIGTGIYLESIDNLTDLSGLNSLTFVGGVVEIIYNYSLQNFIGLENLTQIGGGLSIGYNPVLTSLSGINSLSSINGDIWIEENPILSSINSIENIDQSSILDLHIYGNSLLSNCDMQSICEYLVSPNGIIDIHDNAPGCNSQAEVEAACLNSVGENANTGELTFFPNPATTFITIQIKQGIQIEEAIIYDHLGQKALVAVPVNNSVDVSTLKVGMYILEVVTENRTIREILLVE